MMSSAESATHPSTFARVVWPSIALTLFFVLTASAFVWWHYYICTNPAATGVRHFYARQSSVPGKGMAGYIDLVLPAVIVGFATGLAGARLRPRWTVVHVLIMTAGIAVLQPVFVRWMPAEELWWLPAERKWPLGAMLNLGWRIVLLCGVFAFLGRLYGQRWWGLGDNVEPAGG